MNILPLEKGKVGRPQYEPTQRDRTFVIAMAAHGAVHDEIAQVLGISDVTLRKHFNYELENGLPRAHADVGHTLFMRAVGGPKRDWTKASDTAAIFYAKTQMGWREPPKVIEVGDLRIESLSDRQLDALLERIVARQRRDLREGRAEAAEGECEPLVRSLTN
jgi:predicted transcriptional regulator